MDTLRERQELELLFARGQAPWAIWEAGNAGVPLAALSSGSPT
jgi:hypothetical protein